MNSDKRNYLIAGIAAATLILAVTFLRSGVFLNIGSLIALGGLLLFKAASPLDCEWSDVAIAGRVIGPMAIYEAERAVSMGQTGWFFRSIKEHPPNNVSSQAKALRAT